MVERSAGSESFEYGPPRDQGELDAFRGILQRCFDVPPERGEKWMAQAGHEQLRLLRQDGRVAAGLLFVDMGQHFGGRRIPMWGVAAVGVPPEHRGAGAATELMHRAVREVRAAGAPISSLYPATYPLYRRAGYEHAGSRLRYVVDTAALAGFRSELPVRRIEEQDLPLLEAVYEEHARARPGYLSRGRYVWDRVRQVDGELGEGYLVERDGRARGYVFLVRLKRQPLGYDVGLSDLIALDAPAARRLLALVGAHRSMAPEVRWFEGPAGPVVPLLPERGFRQELDHLWMLRLCDLEGAIAARGFPPGMAAELHLDVEDEVVPENAGAWVLRVADGAGKIERGGRAELALPIGALASLYAGFLSAETLAAAGKASGTPEALRAASAVFAGPAPGMPDMF